MIQLLNDVRNSLSSEIELSVDITNLNDFVKDQPGFVARKTAISDDGMFLDVVYWTDMLSASKASEKSLTSEICIPAFNTIDENELTLDLSSDFYYGSKQSKEKVQKELKNAYIINAVGKEVMQLLIDNNIINKSDVKKISGVPFIQLMNDT